MNRFIAVPCTLLCLALAFAEAAEGKVLKQRSQDRKIPTDWCPLADGDLLRFTADGPAATITFTANQVPGQRIDNVFVVEESVYSQHRGDDPSGCNRGPIFKFSTSPRSFLELFDFEANGWRLAGAALEAGSAERFPFDNQDDRGASLALAPGGSASVTFTGLQKGHRYVVGAWWSTESTGGANLLLSVDTLDATALYLAGGRFKVEASWQSNRGQGVGQAVPLTGDTGYFWFFDPANVEVTVKVIDACPLNGRYWVFASGLTDVKVELRITDTVRGGTKKYVNNLGTAFAPVQDTSALATCP